MTMRVLKRKILDFVEADRADAQVFWIEAFDANGDIYNSQKIQLAVHKMHAAFLNEESLKALSNIKLTKEEINLILKKLNGLSPSLGE